MRSLQDHQVCDLVKLPLDLGFLVGKSGMLEETLYLGVLTDGDCCHQVYAFLCLVKNNTW